MVGLPEKPDQSEQQRQAVEYIVSFVILEVLRQEFLIAYEQVIDERNTGNPVAVFYFSATLNVVLASGEVPHEVTPVHEVQLVGEEELDVLPLGRHIHHDHFSALVVRHVMSLDVNPLLVERGVRGTVHTREKHILCVFILDTSGEFDIRVFFVRRSLFLADILAACFRLAGNTITVFYVECHFGGESRAVEQRACAILLTTEVFAQREDIFR